MDRSIIGIYCYGTPQIENEAGDFFQQAVYRKIFNKDNE
jgi:hypothetical protein